jgi:hypothetical protein
MSALPPKADIAGRQSDVCFVPTLISLFDHLDRAWEKTLRDFVSIFFAVFRLMTIQTARNLH